MLEYTTAGGFLQLLKMSQYAEFSYFSSVLNFMGLKLILIAINKIILIIYWFKKNYLNCGNTAHAVGTIPIKLKKKEKLNCKNEYFNPTKNP